MRKVHLKAKSNRGIRVINDHGNLWTVSGGTAQYYLLTAPDTCEILLDVKYDEDFEVIKEV
jgi:hypothetical protein